MIDMNKIYRTRDQKIVRIYATDGGDEFPVHGAIKGIEGWSTGEWTAEGTFHLGMAGMSSPHDLVEVKQWIKQEVWVNVYRSRNTVHPSRAAADTIAWEDRIACLKFEINCEEGEGLE